MLKPAIIALAAFITATAPHAETGYIPGQPSFDCAKARNTVALILCSGPEAAQVDWNYNAASWAYYFTLSDAGRARMAQDQRGWRQSLDGRCALPILLTPDEQAAQHMARELGSLLGARIVIPGPQPITQVHANCVLDAYRTRAAMYRSKLTGDALAEVRLNPEQRADLQRALAEKGFLRANQDNLDLFDGEFGSNTRNAIKQFQRSVGAAPTGFLSADQRTAVLERPEDRAAREARIAAEAKAKQEAIEAEARAKHDAEAAAEREAARVAAEEAARKALREKVERERLEAAAEAAKQWRLKIDEARTKGREYSNNAESKWSLSAVDNPMIDDKDYSVWSVQNNGYGAVAEIEGACKKPGEVTFVAKLAQTDETALGLPDFEGGYIAGHKRINDDPMFATHFQSSKFRNVILLSSLTTGPEAPEALETTWRVLAEVETSRGRVIMKIPMFESSVQKLIEACGKQYENAINRGRVPDAPLTR
jgi:hypothetical protein